MGMETTVVGKISSSGINRKGKKYPEPAWEQLAELVGKPVTLGTPKVNTAGKPIVGSIKHVSKENDGAILATIVLDAAKMDKDFMGIFNPSQVSMSLRGYGDVDDDGVVRNIEYTMVSIEPHD